MKPSQLGFCPIVLLTAGSAQFSYDLRYQDGAQPQFNGNISAQAWSVASVASNTFNYSYDHLNRLTQGTAPGMSEILTYDFNGNIRTLNRDGTGLAYTYSGNRLTTVTTGNGSYSYDVNGNATRDGRAGLAITYNRLNLPSKVGTVTYIYDAEGRKLRKTAGTVVTHYIDGIQYTGAAIDFIQHEVGVARKSGTSYSYEYNMTDHLGNVRYTFYKNPNTGILTRVQSDDYYPFGLRKEVGGSVSLNNKYLYNGKELQEEFGQYDYGARLYDPVIGRWNVVDPLAEKMRRHSPYNYAFNNPIRFIDPDGMAPEQSGPGPRSKKETNYTGVITLGGQLVGDIKTPFGKLGFEINAAGFDLIGVRDNKFVFFEGKKQAIGISGVVASAKTERTFSEKTTDDGQVERTTTTTAGAGIGSRSVSKEKVEVSKVDYLTGKTTTTATSEKMVQKESWGINIAAIIGLEISKDVILKGPDLKKK